MKTLLGSVHLSTLLAEKPRFPVLRCSHTSPYAQPRYSKIKAFWRKCAISAQNLGMVLFLCTNAFAEPSVAFFYGKQAPILQLCMYDMVVVDPYSNFKPEDCSPVSQAIAYVSVGEVARDAPYEKNIRPEWVIGKNVAWNNNLVIDQTQKEWQQFFIKQLIDPLWKKGYRGFFFDTLDSYFLSSHDSKQQQAQIDGMVSLIQQIKTQYPDAKIILNRGFQLLPKVHSEVDAVVIESLYHAWNQQKLSYEVTPLADQKQLLTQIDTIRQMQLPIIIIDYLPPGEHARAPALANQIATLGLIPWITDKSLQAIYIKKTDLLPRKILLLFTDEHKLPTQYLPSLRFVGTILEYLGYVPDYFNLNEISIYPAGDLKNNYAGIILWLDTQDPKNGRLLTWVQQQIKNHIPVVFLNSFGVSLDTRELNQLHLFPTPTKDSIQSLKITTMNAEFIGYEVKPSLMPYYFFPLRAATSQILLQLKNNHQQTEDAVAITSWGGYALNPYVIQFLPNFYGLWVIDPFKFFKRALRLRDFPIPDTTTENGRRLMSVHVDGDGFAYPAKWIGGRFAAEELRDRVLKKFRIPTSFSVITGEIAPDGANPKSSPQLMKIARSIFALPWIEMASHSFSHPLNWQHLTGKTSDLPISEPYALKIPHYKCNITTELGCSVDFIKKYLAPHNKKDILFFWSGLANPTAKALRMAQDINVLNINGLSDTDINYHDPWLTGIRPMGMNLGKYYQVFAPIQMDFYYMNSFSGPMYGFEQVIQTLQLTDKPRRFKPIDIYYHIYAASQLASLQALIKVYRWALTQPVMNIYISDYIKKVLDYYHIQISRTDNTWMLYSNGDLRELRSYRHFGYPDLTRSHNIIGFKENKDDLYIHLGPNHLTVLNYQQEPPQEPYLVEANAPITAFSKRINRKPQHKKGNGLELVMQFQGDMPVQFTLANIKQCRLVSKTPLKVKQNKDHTMSYFGSEEALEIHIYC